MDIAFESLTWNDDLGWWTGTAEVASDHLIDLHLQAGQDTTALKIAVSHASPLWERLRMTEPGIRATVAEQMTEAHNDLCAVEDEVTTAQFAGRLRLLSALFQKDGTLELCYHDGMLLGGHWIIVPIAADGRVGEAHEAG